MVLIGGASIGGEIINHKLHMVDLEVYYVTAQRILNGEQIYARPVYGIDHYVFKYSPTGGSYFVPLSLVPFQYALYLYWIILMAIPAWAMSLFYRLLSANEIEGSFQKRNLVIGFSLLVILTHYHREITLGQVNLLLASLYMGLIYLYTNNKRIWFSVLLSISLFLKPFALIFIPYLLIRKEFLQIAYCLVFTLLLGLVPLLFYPSFSQLAQLYAGWIHELLTELGSKQALVADTNHTIFSVLARFTPIRFLLVSEIAEAVYQVLLIGLMSFGVLALTFHNREVNPCLSEMSLLIAMIPLLAFTSENAFVFTLPMVMYLCYHFNRLSSPQRIAFITGGLLIGGNDYDLVGQKMNAFFMDLSVYTVGTMLLIGCLVSIALVGPLKSNTSGRSKKGII